ncbi:MAG TPA: RNA polymerase sigma factor [Candidatus Peribacterales bacterium]|nr:RNA polymerase sigma factor [Candidatus Peribacterales bacterium]
MFPNLNPLRATIGGKQKKQEETLMRAYDLYADAIFRHCYFRVFSRERAKELMQETFLRTWTSMVKGEEIRHMRGYLYRIANNLIIDEARRKKEQSLDALEEQGFDPPDETQENVGAKNVDGEIILTLLHKLEEPYREVVTLRYIDGFRPMEIANILGVSANVVSVRLHRGIAMLQELLPKDF